MSQAAYLRVLKEIANAAHAAGRDPKDIALIAVTKGNPWPQTSWLYDAGQRVFGENRLPEAFEKMESAPADCQWHFIGTLQTNKVRKAIGKFSLIHSVDSLELAQKLSECSLDVGIKTNILLQANTSGEASKHGLTPDAWKRCFEEVISLKGIQVQGLMTMAPLTEDLVAIQRCFAGLRYLRDALDPSLPHLSMGMSHDFPLAIAEGATIVRIGTALFVH